MGMHMHMCMYECVHIGAEIYPCGNYEFFLASIKGIRMVQQLKEFYYHTIMSTLETHCLPFLCPIWVAESPEIGMFPSWIYNKESESAAREVDKRPMQEDTDTEGQTKEKELEVLRAEDLAVFRLAKSEDATKRRFVSHELLPLNIYSIFCFLLVLSWWDCLELMHFDLTC